MFLLKHWSLGAIDMKRKGLQIYEGKAKILYECKESQDLAIQFFKDDATAFDGNKRGTIGNQGLINNAISTRLFQYLEKNGIKTHFVEKVAERDMLVKRVEMIPLEIIVRNVAAGSLSKRTGWEEGTPLSRPVVEICYKNDALHDPMFNDEHVLLMDLATEEEIRYMKDVSHKVNQLLIKYLESKNLVLIDMKLEFGRVGGEILLADEISPDTCRFWDKQSGEKLDKDRFRRDLGRVEESYQEVYKRICIEN